MEPGRALVVTIVSSGIAHNRFIRISELFDASDLEKIEKSLESNLHGVDLNSLNFGKMKIITMSKNVNSQVYEDLLYEIYVSIKQANELDVNVTGIENLTNVVASFNSSRLEKTKSSLASGIKLPI